MPEVDVLIRGGSPFDVAVEEGRIVATGAELSFAVWGRISGCQSLLALTLNEGFSPELVTADPPSASA